MKQNIYKYIFSIILLLGWVSFAYGQELESEEEAEVETEISDSIQSEKKAFYNGFRIDLDVLPLALNFINKHEKFNYEAAIQVDLLEKYYPVFELGYGGANKLTPSDIAYKGNAMYYRLGMDFNLIKNKDETALRNYFFLGARLGYNYLNYSVRNIVLEGGAWGENQILNYDLSNSNLWFEVVGGVRVEVYKNVYIGWNMRAKNLLLKADAGAFKPWYIPGFGVDNDAAVWSFNYLIGYKL